MAGYIFALDSEGALLDCFKKGAYSTRVSKPRHLASGDYNWNSSHEGTLADYASMKEGDFVYFFIKRKLYGIGKLKNILGDCKYCNFPSSLDPKVEYMSKTYKDLLIDFGENNIFNRWVCFF